MNQYLEIPVNLTIDQLTANAFNEQLPSKKYQFCSFHIEVSRMEGIVFVGKQLIKPNEWNMYSNSHRHLLLVNKIIETLGVDFNSSGGKQLIALINYLTVQLNPDILFGPLPDMKNLNHNPMQQLDQMLTLQNIIRNGKKYE